MSLTDDLRRGYTPGIAPEVSTLEPTLPQTVEEVARRHPQRVALDLLSRSIIYVQLIDRVRRAVSVLARAGVAPDDRVALMMPNCPQHVIAILAIATLGDIIVERNPLSPVLETEKEFEAYDARVIIAWEKPIDKLAFLKDEATVFSVDLIRAMSGATQLPLRPLVKVVKEKHTVLSAKPPTWTWPWDHGAMQSPCWLNERPVSLDDLALLIHTGGTTDIPKGAALTYHNILANIAQSIVWVPVLHEGVEVFYCVLSLFHAFGFTVGLSAGLRFGASVALFLKFDTTVILMSQKRLSCTFFLGIPPMCECLSRTVETVDVDLSSTTLSPSGTMPLSGKLTRCWREATGGFMVEGYGMTKVSPAIFGSPLPDPRRSGVLGIPLPSTQARIVDPKDPRVDVPEGETGELIVKGPQVFSGYWERPEEAAEVLWNGWLRTGDLARVQNGFIHMADRHEGMINASGFNVYPSQVEDAVRDMLGIRDIAVTGPPAGNAGESVVAAIAPETDVSTTLTDVRQWAERPTVHYALSRQIVVMTELPCSRLDKVMRKRVREQILDTADSVLTVASQVWSAADQMHGAADQVRGVADPAAASTIAKLHSLKNRE